MGFVVAMSEKCRFFATVFIPWQSDRGFTESPASVGFIPAGPQLAATLVFLNRTRFSPSLSVGFHPAGAR